MSTLQIKCEVLTAQLEMARGALSESCSSSRSVDALVPVLLAASARMSSSLRAMLILCLEEGVEVGDAELQSLRDDLKSLRLDLNLPDDTYTPEPPTGDAQMFADIMSGMPAEWLADGAGAKGGFDCYTPAILLLCDEVARFESDVLARRDHLIREAASHHDNRTDDNQRCSVGSTLSSASSSCSSMMLVAADNVDTSDVTVANTNNKRGQKRKKDATGTSEGGDATGRTKQSRHGDESDTHSRPGAADGDELSSLLRRPPRLSTSSESSAGSDNISAASSSIGGINDAEGLDAMLDGISRKEFQVGRTKLKPSYQPTLSKPFVTSQILSGVYR